MLKIIIPVIIGCIIAVSPILTGMLFSPPPAMDPYDSPMPGSEEEKEKRRDELKKMMTNFQVMDKKTKKLYTVYAVQEARTIHGEALFLIYRNRILGWSWVNAENYTPNFEDDGSGNLVEVE